MTDLADIYNRALQSIGTRTTVTLAEIANNETNEAIQANLVYENTRDSLLRMAPWDCAIKTANLVYITSAPGTPENTSTPTTLWTPGQPPPPWAYEYQYPNDCLRACWIIPATQSGFAGGVPITTAVTGGASSFWQGPPVKFKVQTDQFRAMTAVTVNSGGVGYAIGDIITLALPAASGVTISPLGAAALVRVLTVGGLGNVLTAEVISQVYGASTPIGGSYFEAQANPIGQESTTGNGTGVTFLTVQNKTPSPQRVILTNQEFATLSYVQRVTDVNVFDDLFTNALSDVLAAEIAMALSGDKALSNKLIGSANDIIEKARAADGNEGLTTNDVTPDFIRVRGINNNAEGFSGPYSSFDWGTGWGYYG